MGDRGAPSSSLLTQSLAASLYSAPPLADARRPGDALSVAVPPAGSAAVAPASAPVGAPGGDAGLDAATQEAVRQYYEVLQVPTPRQVREHVPPARRKTHAGLTPLEELLDADPSGAPPLEYRTDIHWHMLTQELKTMPGDSGFMKAQPQINFMHRTQLIEWLMEVMCYYNLRLDTLQLAVNLMDRYSALREVPLTEYQALGTMALWIAAKFEENHGRVPSLHSLITVAKHPWKAANLCRLERRILTVLGFAIGHPCVEAFRRLCRLDDGIVSVRHGFLTQYLGELLLTRPAWLNYRPSLIARATSALASIIMRQRVALPQDARVWDCIHALTLALPQPSAFVRKKYRKDAYERVSVLADQWHRMVTLPAQGGLGPADAAHGRPLGIVTPSATPGPRDSSLSGRVAAAHGKLAPSADSAVSLLTPPQDAQRAGRAAADEFADHMEETASVGDAYATAGSASPAAASSWAAAYGGMVAPETAASSAPYYYMAAGRPTYLTARRASHTGSLTAADVVMACSSPISPALPLPRGTPATVNPQAYGVPGQGHVHVPAHVRSGLPPQYARLKTPSIATDVALSDLAPADRTLITPVVQGGRHRAVLPLSAEPEQSPAVFRRTSITTDAGAVPLIGPDGVASELYLCRSAQCQSIGVERAMALGAAGSNPGIPGCTPHVLQTQAAAVGVAPRDAGYPLLRVSTTAQAAPMANAPRYYAAPPDAAANGDVAQRQAWLQPFPGMKRSGSVSYGGGTAPGAGVPLLAAFPLLGSLLRGERPSSSDAAAPPLPPPMCARSFRD